MRLYIGIFYIYFPYQKYLSCEDWKKIYDRDSRNVKGGKFDFIL